MDALNDLVKTLVAELGAALASVIAIAVVGALAQLMRKWGFDISAAKRAKLEAAATTAVLRAEEEAAVGLQRAIQAGGQALAPTGAAKFESALAYTRAAVPDAKADDIVAQVTAALPATGFGAAAKQATPAADTPPRGLSPSTRL